MKLALLAQWRLVHWRFVLFTLLSALIPPYLAANGGRDTLPAGVTLWPAFLAASLPSRLFARQAAEQDGAYWGALPLSRSRWFGLRLGMVLGLMGASLGIDWLAWRSPLATGIFDAVFTPDRPHGITERILVHAEDGTMRAAFLPPQFSGTLALTLLVLAATTYFASSFERASAAWQAGLPGFCFGFMAIEVLEDDVRAMQPWILWSATLGLLALSLACAQHLQHQRGMCTSDRRESILGRGSRSTTALHVIGQCCFVVAPLVSLFRPDLDMSPKPALTNAELFWLVIGVLSISVLPGTLRELRSLGRTVREAAAVLILRTSLVGVPIWKVLRRQSPAVHCARCGERRLARLVECPECHARATRIIYGLGRRLSLEPSGPWGVAIIAFAGFLVIAMLLSWIPRSPTWEWHIETTIPGVALSAMGSDVLSPSLAGPLPAESPSILPSDERFVLGYTIAHASPFTSDDLRRAVADYARMYPQVDPFRDARVGLLPQDLRFDVRAPGTEVFIRSFQTTVQSDLLTIRSVTRLSLDFPSYVEKSRRLVDMASDGPVGDRETAEAAALGDAFLVLLMREMDSRFSGSASSGASAPALGVIERLVMERRLHTFLDSVVRARRPGEWRADREEARRLLRELDERLRRFNGRGGPDGPPLDLALFFAPLRELSWVAAEDELNDEILSGLPFAALAAGMRASPACFDACSRLAELAMDNSGRASGDEAMRCRLRLLCSAWAMLRIDAPQATTWLLDRLSGRPFDDLESVLTLLGYSGRPEVESRLNALWPALSTRIGYRLTESLNRCISHLHSKRTPKEYWLGW